MKIVFESEDGASKVQLNTEYKEGMGRWLENCAEMVSCKKPKPISSAYTCYGTLVFTGVRVEKMPTIRSK